MNEIIQFAACAFIASLIHTLTKIAKVNKMSGDVVFKDFVKSEWPYMAISALTIILSLIAHSAIDNVRVVYPPMGDGIVLVAYMLIGWASDSIFYNIFGKLERKVLTEIKEKLNSK